VTAGAVLVIGGGLTGLHAAIAVAEAGATAIVLEQGPVVGGKRAAWLSGDSDSGLDPRLAAAPGNDAIEIHTLAEIESLAGAAGEFSASICLGQRFVTGDCTSCNHCVPVCPQVVANEYDAGLTFRKAIHKPWPEAFPAAYVIDLDACLNVPPNYLPCQRCVEVCDDHAIFFDLPQREIVERRVAAVIVATGFASESAEEESVLAEFGYGQAANIVSSVELQRLLEDPGPSGGFAIKPSDEEYPDSVLLVLTRVSADAAWVMGNQLRRLATQDIDQLSVLVLAPPGDTAQLTELLETVEACGASLHWGSWVGVQEAQAAATGGGGKLQVRHRELPAGRDMEQLVDLLVLSSEVHADTQAASLAGILGLGLDAHGYISPSRAGIYLAGGALGTVGIEAGAEQARLAVEKALQHVAAGVEAVADPVADLEWSRLPPDRQRQYLEQMLHTLFSLGNGR
jgi:heterodisulfide reductase subunit A